MADQKFEIREYDEVAARFTELAGRIGKRVYDVTTKDGMAVAVTDRREVRTIRVNLERIRKELKEPALRRCQQIDSEARTLTRQLEEIEAVPDTAIKAEEKRLADAKAEKERAERLRVEGIHEAIRAIESLPISAIGKSGDEVAAMVSSLVVAFGDSKFDEFATMARVAYDATVAKLEQMRKDAIAAAEEQARLAAERAAFEEQQKERDAAAAAEEARLAEERRVLAEQQDALRQQQAAEQAERDRVAAEQEAERQRIAQEQAAIEAQKAEIAAAQDKAEAEKVAAAFAEKELKIIQPTSHAPFAPVGTDIHEDMARIYEIALGDGNERDVDAITAKQLDDIATIARGWIED